MTMRAFSRLLFHNHQSSSISSISSTRKFSKTVHHHHLHHRRSNRNSSLRPMKNNSFVSTASSQTSEQTLDDRSSSSSSNTKNKVMISRSHDENKIHLPTFIALLVDIAEDGCEIIREVTTTGEMNVTDKGGSENLDKRYVMDAQTEADRRVEMMALKRISTFAPKVRVIGEESYEDALLGDDDEEDEQKQHKHYCDKDVLKEVLEAKWSPSIASGEIDISRVNVYVDPLDGTNEYANGERPAVTVLLGVAVDGVPVAGIIGQPFFGWNPTVHSSTNLKNLGRVVWGGSGVGCMGLQIDEKQKKLEMPPNGPHVVCLNRNTRDERQAPVMKQTKSEVSILVSATGFHYLCLLEGRAHSALLLRKASKKWDTCAGEALLRSVGGAVTDTVGRRYNYDCDMPGVPNVCGMAASIDIDLHLELTHSIIQKEIEKLGSLYPYDVECSSIKAPILKDAYRKNVTFKALSVDAGGVLLVPTRAVHDVYAEYAKKFGFLDVTPESAKKAFKTVFSVPLSDKELRYVGNGRTFWEKCVFTALNVDKSNEDSLKRGNNCLDALIEFYEKTENWSVAPGAIAAFRRLRSRGIKVVVTSNWDDRLPTLLKNLNVASEVDAIYASAIGGFEKPHPNAFKKSLESIGITNESDYAHVVHVGDSDTNDILGAKNFGIGFPVKWGGDRANARASPAFDFQELADEMIASTYVFGDRKLNRKYFI